MPVLNKYSLQQEQESYTSKMTHYVVKEEILNHFFGTPGIGNVTYLSTQCEIPMDEDAKKAYSARITNHKMEAVIKALIKDGYGNS